MPKKHLLKKILHILEASFAFIILFFLGLLPINTTSSLGGIVGRKLGPLTKAHRTAKKNLLIALPELSPSEHNHILDKAWDNFGRVLTEYAHLHKFSNDKEKNRITIDGIEKLQLLDKREEPFIIFFGHLGNWEMNGLCAISAKKTSSIIYRPPNNPYIADRLLKIRDLGEDVLIPKGMKGAIKAIKKIKNNGIVLMAMDQKMNNGLSIPFFRKNAMTGDAIARLAIKYKCSILPLRSQRLDGCNFKLTFENPWLWNENENQNTHNILIRINQTLERWIRDKPEQWLWFHNRWPTEKILK